MSLAFLSLCFLKQYLHFTKQLTCAVQDPDHFHPVLRRNHIKRLIRGCEGLTKKLRARQWVLNSGWGWLVACLPLCKLQEMFCAVGQHGVVKVSKQEFMSKPLIFWEASLCKPQILCCPIILLRSLPACSIMLSFCRSPILSTTHSA